MTRRAGNSIRMILAALLFTSSSSAQEVGLPDSITPESASPESVAPHASPHGEPYQRGPRRPPVEELLELHADRLELDADTLVQIRTIADGSRAESEPLAHELQERRREMRALLDVDAPDLDAVLRQVERMGEAEIALDKHHLRTMLEIRTLLTPAQRQELVRLHRDRKREHRARRSEKPADR